MSARNQRQFRSLSQCQTVRDKRLKIPHIYCGYSSAAANSNRSNHAVGETTCAAARTIEQVGGKLRIFGKQRIGRRNDLSRKRCSDWINWPAHEFSPSYCADPKRFS